MSIIPNRKYFCYPNFFPRFVVSPLTVVSKLHPDSLYTYSSKYFSGNGSLEHTTHTDTIRSVIWLVANLLDDVTQRNYTLDYTGIMGKENTKHLTSSKPYDLIRDNCGGYAHRIRVVDNWSQDLGHGSYF